MEIPKTRDSCEASLRNESFNNGLYRALVQPAEITLQSTTGNFMGFVPLSVGTVAKLADTRND